jgi:hypothetical protein
MIREAFSAFEKRFFLGEEGVSNSIFNLSWVAVFPKKIQQENAKGFSSVSSFLKLRSLRLTHVLASLRQQNLQ